MVCDTKCRSCMYASTLGNMSVVCNYLLVTGNRRGCPAGKGCERYIKGKHAIAIDNSVAPRKKPAAKKPVDQREKKRRYRERTQAMWQGRQHDAIQAWCQENKVSYTKLARMLGVSETTVAYWAKEYAPARWDKLEKLGIRKPEAP